METIEMLSRHPGAYIFCFLINFITLISIYDSFRDTTHTDDREMCIGGTIITQPIVIYLSTLNPYLLLTYMGSLLLFDMWFELHGQGLVAKCIYRMINFKTNRLSELPLPEGGGFQSLGDCAYPAWPCGARRPSQTENGSSRAKYVLRRIHVSVLDVPTGRAPIHPDPQRHFLPGSTDVARL